MATHLPTQLDVAQRAGVSRRLVSAVLHNNDPNIRVSPATRERVRRAAAELGYRPNIVARSLVTGKTRTLGFVITTLANPFFGELSDALQRAAAVHGYDVAIAVSGGGFANQAHQVEKLLARQVDGLLVWAGRARSEYEALACLGPKGPPLVVLGTGLPDAATSCVAVDRAGGVADAVAHLARLGHTRFGYAGYDARPGHQPHFPSKFQGFCRGLAALALAPDRIWPFEPFPWDADHRPLVLSVAEEIAAGTDLPSALIAEDDPLALALLAALARAGRRVPADAAVIGYDDVPAATTSVPALTTVAQPTRELAQEALRALLALMEDPCRPPHRALLRPRLVIRESCGAPRGVGLAAGRLVHGSHSRLPMEEP
jgi:LacI family transcriptional regulator